MPICSSTAARILGRVSDWSVSNLHMQKLLYIAHMFYLGRTGQRLISEPFEAWDYGPVLPSLYKKIKIFGSSPVKNIFWDASSIDENAPEFLMIKEAFEKLRVATPGRLVAITHRAGGAWEKNYVPQHRGAKIPDADIIAEYNLA